MILKCASCAAPIDLSHLPSGHTLTEVVCTACGSTMPIPMDLQSQRERADIFATDQNVPQFKAATATLDAPLPDEELEYEPPAFDATRRPRDVLRAPGTQPLDTPLPLGNITATSSGRKPPPLPGQRPTATTTGMPAPSMVGAHLKKTPPAIPGTDEHLRSAQATGPKTGEFASDSLVPRDIDMASVAPSHPVLPSSVGGLHQTSKDMPAILPPEPSLIEAVDHLTTGEIPKVAVAPMVPATADFDDEVPEDIELVDPRGGKNQARASFFSGMGLSAIVAIGAYLLMGTPVDTNDIGPPSQTQTDELAQIHMLMDAVRFEDRDTKEARKHAKGLYQSLSQSLTAEEQAGLRQVAQYGLARVIWVDSQYAALRGSEFRETLSEVEELLRTLEHPNAELLRLRIYRLLGQKDLFQQGIDRYTGEKGAEYRLERALRQAPTIKADPAERLRRLNALPDELLNSPTVWALRTEAALASGQFETAAKVLESAPRGSDRAFFLKKLSTLRSQSKGTPSTRAVAAVKTDAKTKLPPIAQKKTTPAPTTAVPVKNSAKAPRIDPNAKSKAPSNVLDFDAMMSKGLSLLERGDEGRAEPMFRQAAELRPKRPEPHTNLGYCAHSQKRYAKAVQHFQKALRLRGDFADALYGLGNAYRAMGRVEQARQTFRRYLDRHPSGPQARMARARLEELGTP